VGRGVGRAWARVRALEGRACAPLSCAVGTPTAVRELSVWVGERSERPSPPERREFLAKSPVREAQKSVFCGVAAVVSGGRSKWEEGSVWARGLGASCNWVAIWARAGM
jgi:hypothetical protein